jgi:anti-sigma B factor antagonist
MGQYGSTPTPRSPDQAPGAALVEMRVNRLAEAVVVSVRGELDPATAPELRTCLGQWAGSGRPLVVDLDGVRFLGAAGLSVLVEARNETERRGADLRLVCNGRPARRPLDVTGLSQTFATYRTVPDAVRGHGTVGAA